jgi:hypothetical protein
MPSRVSDFLKLNRWRGHRVEQPWLNVNIPSFDSLTVNRNLDVGSGNLDEKIGIGPGFLSPKGDTSNTNGPSELLDKEICVIRGLVS